MKSWSVSIRTVLTVMLMWMLALWTSACSEEQACTTCTGDAMHDATRSDARMDSTTTDVGPDPRGLVSIRITPDAPTLTVRNGMPLTQTFQAVATRRDGTDVTLGAATWSVANTRLGTIDSMGVFTSNNTVAGNVEVRVEARGEGTTLLMATTTLTVVLEREILGMGVPTDAATHFGSAVTSATEGPVVVYPLDRALMPNNVSPPDVQWNPVGAMGDLFRVQLTKPGVTVTAYALHSGGAFRHDWLVPATAWAPFAESAVDDPITLTVQRWDRANDRVFTAGAPITFTLARGSIGGVIYYWDLSDGTIQKIDTTRSTGTASRLIPNPPPRPRDGKKCVACHSVSRDGRFLSAELWDGWDYSTVFDLTSDLTANPAPTVFPLDRVKMLFSSFSPDSRRIVYTDENTDLRLADPATGLPIAATGLPTTATHPDWSPDGQLVAFIRPTADNAVDFTSSELRVVPANANNAFGAEQLLHAGPSLATSPEQGSADSHPTWSPDSQYIAFGHGPDSRSNQNATLYPGALYLVGRNGSSARRLSNASGGTNATQSYWPTFSPFRTEQASGGVFWLAFYSRRPYGNNAAGTGNRGTRQLWVTAIDVNATTPDPSHAPYWLAGQDVATHNMAAYWAPAACRMNDTECRTNSECCSGQCLPDPGMPARRTCQPPPTTMCRQRFETCGGTGDCCEGLTCFANVCDRPPG